MTTAVTYKVPAYETPIVHDPEEEAAIKAREAEEQKDDIGSQMEADTVEWDESGKETCQLIQQDGSGAGLVGTDVGGVVTSNFASYIEQELGELSRDIEVYNVLPCPTGAIQGDAREIARDLQSSFDASILESSNDSLMKEPPSFANQIENVTQLVSMLYIHAKYVLLQLTCTNKGVFLTSLAPNPDGNPASRKIKQVSKLYGDRVKFMQVYRKILFIVGSELIEETRDFSAKQVTVIQQNNSKILARLRFNEEIVFFKIMCTVLIVSAGGGLYMFCLRSFKKMESLQCNSVFQTYMEKRANSANDVGTFRIIYSDPG